MSLANVETALLNYVGDVLVNTCDRPVPDRVLRYHGTLPHDCCTPNGFLVSSWERRYRSARFPNATPEANCQGVPVGIVVLRYVVCWPLPEVGTDGVRPIDDSWDDQAAMLASVADCVEASLVRLGCGGVVTDELAQAVVSLTGREGIRYIETTPIVPLGGCAGVQWRLYARLRSTESPS